MYEEHIEAAERLLAQNRSRPVPMFEANELAFFAAAIKLMRAAEPQSESQELDRVYAVLTAWAEKYGVPLGGAWPFNELIEQRAAVRAELEAKYQAEIEAWKAASDDRDLVKARLTETRTALKTATERIAELEQRERNLKLSTMHTLREAEELETKLQELRTAAERMQAWLDRSPRTVVPEADDFRAAIEASKK